MKEVVRGLTPAAGIHEGLRLNINCERDSYVIKQFPVNTEHFQMYKLIIIF